MPYDPGQSYQHAADATAQTLADAGYTPEQIEPILRDHFSPPAGSRERALESFMAKAQEADGANAPVEG